MRLTIFAATGGVGHHLLQQAVAAGHDVTAVVRNPANLTEQGGGVRVVTADLAAPDPGVLASAVDGRDAVLSGLGPRRPRSDAGITSRGTRAVVAAMQAADVRRLVVVSAAPIGTVASPARPNPPKHDAGDGFFMRHLGAPFARTMFGAHYADLAVMEDLVRDSGLDWTISRPPRFTDKPLTGVYRTAFEQNLRGGTHISRADVAHHMLSVLDHPETIRRTMGVAY
ncbi:NAD(P)-dependent oxidoreductase [Streptomyces herbicida]|uniref:NAD(P)-dependent oxidoreductase n=1 Tax=Streptomyces herbicida TaxID=3065675 RepID=UPI00292EB7A4|nr:SDR family oxidoreductase [Streptomyces sp. NEAU-HV9]